MKLSLIRTIFFALAIHQAVPSASAAAETILEKLPNPDPQVSISSTSVPKGNTVMVTIDTRRLSPPPKSLKIEFQKQVVPMAAHPLKGQGIYIGMLGIPYHTDPGPASLSVSRIGDDGEHSQTIRFTVTAGNYRSEILQVDPSRVTPSTGNRERARRERLEIKKVYAGAIPTRLWRQAFQFPLDSKITSVYGTRRTFNNQLKSYHIGTDFRAPIGTPLHAANSGVVKLTKNLFYAGNTIIIDHGMKIFSIYAHLSKIDLSPGQHVAIGQRLGLTGATGRVSGPHLHWGIKVDGVNVDPLQFVELISSIF